MTLKKEIRIGYIGAGANTKNRHIPGFSSIEGIINEVVCNRSLESSEKVASEFGMNGVADDWMKVIENPKVDAVCIGTWPYLHAEATIAALEAGKHVLTEARMAMNLKEAEQMLSVSQKFPHLVAQIVPAPFTLQYDDWIINALKSNLLGRLQKVECVDVKSNSLNPLKPATWRQIAKYSGLNIMSVGIFYETIQRWLGKEDPLDLAANKEIRTMERDLPGEGMFQIEIPDRCLFTARYASGLELNGHFSQLESGEPKSYIRIQGENGDITFNQQKSSLVLQLKEKPPEIILPAPAETSGWRVEKDFIDSIREGKTVRLTPFEDGVRYMRFTQRLWDSFDLKGERVSF